MTTTDSTSSLPIVWPSMRYADAPTALDFLTRVVGFELVVSYPSADDSTIIEHAQLRWPEGGGIMLGSQRDSPGWPATVGHAATYIVTRHAGEVHERVQQAPGFRILEPLRGDPYDESTGAGQSFGFADPEGNLWSLGTYRGENG